MDQKNIPGTYHHIFSLPCPPAVVLVQGDRWLMGVEVHQSRGVNNPPSPTNSIFALSLAFSARTVAPFAARVFFSFLSTPFFLFFFFCLLCFSEIRYGTTFVRKLRARLDKPPPKIQAHSVFPDVTSGGILFWVENVRPD